jgi:hypothetical protein
MTVSLAQVLFGVFLGWIGCRMVLRLARYLVARLRGV